MNALRRLLSRPDFKSNPARAVWRRASWRVRWQVDDRLWEHRFGPGLRIALPRRGTAVQIHYHGLSEPETAAFLQRALRPGMRFWDIGAHIGEYTLLAAHAVGPNGHVHAFEANPAMLSVLETNVKLNAMDGVYCRGCAMSDAVGEAEFVIQSDPALSSLSRAGTGSMAVGGARTIRLPATTVDAYASEHGTPHLIKIDVEGAELLVFRGGAHVFGAPAHEAPMVVFEYSPGNYEALGLETSDTLEFLRSRHYRIYHLDHEGRPKPFERSMAMPATLNLVASKTPL